MILWASFLPPLRDLLAYTLGGSQQLLVPGHDGQGEILRTSGQDSHGGLGTHAVDGGQQLIAALLLTADKAVEVEGILPDGFGDVQPGGLIQLQLGSGIGGDPAAVANAAAVDHGKARLQNSHRPGNVV